MKLSGWGRFPVLETRVERPGSIPGVRSLLDPASTLIARGNGRAYGDAAIGIDRTATMLSLDRALILETEEEPRIRVEAGMLLSRLIALLLPRGFFPPAVPGTSFVTVGGMVASDVHGKNHHGSGSFGDHVTGLRLMLPSGELVDCSPQSNPALFYATIGGMGLTGIILEVEMRLMRIATGWIRQRTEVAKDLREALAILERNTDATYSVAWIDCIATGRQLGRSLVYLGEHAAEAEASAAGKPAFPPMRSSRLSVPIDFPGFALNGLSMRAFNELYYRAGKRHDGKDRLVDWRSYFFPLDSIAEWNRIYGGRGFVQFQAALPKRLSEAGLTELLGEITRFGLGSFLAVLKLFGPGTGRPSPLSFPIEGATLALDFPMRAGTPPLMARLEAITRAHGGRIYLAKDALQSRETFEAGYPALGAFASLRSDVDPGGRLASAQSRRLGLA